MNRPPSEASNPLLSAAAPAAARELAARSRRGARWAAVATSSRGALVLVDQAVVSATSLLATVVVGRVGGAEQLGLFVLAMTAVVFAAVVHDSLVCSPLIVYGAAFDRQRRAQFSRSMLGMHVLVSLAAMLLAALVALLVAALLAPAAWHALLWLMVLVLPCTLAREFSRRFALARRSPRAALGIDLLQLALLAGSLLLLAAYGQISAASALAALAFASLLAGGLGLWAQRHEIAGDAPRAARDWRTSLRFGRWIVAARAASIFSAYSMHWLLAIWLSKAATGVFAACNTITMFTNPLVLGWSAFLGPQAAAAYAERRRQGLVHVVNQSILLLGSIMVVLSTAAIVGGEHFLRWLYGGGQYAGAGTVIAVLALNVLVGAVSVCLSHGLTTLRRPDLNLQINLVSLALTLAAAWPLVAWWHLTGAALALLLGNVVGTGIQAWQFYRLSRSATA